MNDQKLGEFLREVSNWYWDEFIAAENDDQYTTNESVIFALVRSCAMERMDAIRMSLNRLDGKLKTPIKVEYPSIYFLYPNATALEGGEIPLVLDEGEVMTEPEVLTGELMEVEQPEPSDHEDELPTLSLRQTLSKMSGYSRVLPNLIVKAALQTEQWKNGQAEEPNEIPRVKSVIAAHLLIMAQNRDIGALTEVFDQLDGKLVETLQVLGDDIYITNYSSVAPPGATLNKDGVLQIEAVQSQDAWAAKLKRNE